MTDYDKNPEQPAEPDWFENYKNQLEQVLTQDKVTLDQVAETVYKYGILEHISPADPDAAKQRREQGKDTYDRGSDFLYKRIIYSALYTKNAYEQNQSTFAGYSTQAIAVAVVEISQRGTIYKALFDKQNSNPYTQLVDKVVELAQKDIEALTGKREKIITHGTEFNYEGARIATDGYTSDGQIKLKLKPGQDDVHRFAVMNLVESLSGQIGEALPAEIIEVLTEKPKTENVVDDSKKGSQRLADELIKLNEAAGVYKDKRVVLDMTDLLKRGYFMDAMINVKTADFDKFDGIPEIKDWVIKNLFQNFQHPWEFEEDFIERLSQKNTPVVREILHQNEYTLGKLAKNLENKGYHLYPPISLTTTKFSPEAKFETVEISTPEKELERVLKEVEGKTNKKYVGKVVVREYGHEGGKGAYVFFRTEVKRQNPVDGWNTGTSVWTESDGTIVCEAISTYGAPDEKIKVMISKRYYPQDVLEEKLEELSGSNLPIEIEEPDDPDYIRFHIDLKKTHNANLVFNSLKTEFDNWFTRP